MEARVRADGAAERARLGIGGRVVCVASFVVVYFLYPETQKPACSMYSRHPMRSWSTGVSCPTIQFHTQFVAAACDAPLARNASGMLAGVHAHGMGPQE